MLRQPEMHFLSLTFQVGYIQEGSSYNLCYLYYRYFYYSYEHGWQFWSVGSDPDQKI